MQFSRPINCLDATVDIELTENIPVVVTYGIYTDDQSFGDFLVFVPLGHQA